MFVDSQDLKPSTVWSIAKYSVEVFAALIGPSDELNVYRMSDYGPTPHPTTPTVTLNGAEPRSDRVSKIHNLELEGASTPWASITTAAANLDSSDAQKKWLVILTDGQFKIDDKDVPTAEVIQFLQSTAAKGISIAFMSIGGDAVVIPAGPELMVTRVTDASALLQAMTGFANTIFERTVADLGAGQTWPIDIPMKEVLLLAQGAGVTVVGAQTTAGPVEPADQVDVRWINNKRVSVDGIPINPEPDKKLEGVLAQFTDIPAGDVSFDVTNASKVDVFYKPNVEFGYTISDPQGVDVGNVLTASSSYTLNYSFMDANCVPINSDLLNPVAYSGQILSGDQVVVGDLPPGGTINLPPANYTLRVAASYNGGTAQAEIPLIVNAADGSQSYPVSTMAEFPSPSQGIPFPINVKDGKLSRPITAQEWQALDPSAVTFSGGGNLDYQLVKGERPGDAIVLIRAPEGDVYAADTGNISVTVTVPPVGDIQGLTSAPIGFTVTDDLSGLQRFTHWFWTVGIWILFLLALLVLLLGYIFKKRFPKIPKQPETTARSRMIGSGGTPPKARAKFRINGVRRWLPFVADRATLTYVPPGTTGFIPLRVKASAGRRMRLLNVTAVAKRGNVQINGTPVDEHFNSSFLFGKGTTITASSPNMTFDTTL